MAQSMLCWALWDSDTTGLYERPVVIPALKPIPIQSAAYSAGLTHSMLYYLS